MSSRDLSLAFYIAEPFIKMIIQEKKIKDAQGVREKGKVIALINCDEVLDKLLRLIEALYPCEVHDLKLMKQAVA